MDYDLSQKNGRILVNDKFQIENYTNCFAVGDIAIIKGKEDLPVTAQVAIQEGKHLATNLYLLDIYIYKCIIHIMCICICF